MNKIKHVATRFGRFCSRHKTELAASLVALSCGLPQAAGADVIESGFTSAQASLVGDLGYAVGLVLAILAVGLGIRMIVKWARRGVSAT